MCNLENILEISLFNIELFCLFWCISKLLMRIYFKLFIVEILLSKENNREFLDAKVLQRRGKKHEIIERVLQLFGSWMDGDWKLFNSIL